MGESLVRPTSKADKLVQAVLDPTVQTVAEAGRRAGYGRRQSASAALRSPAVQSQLARLKAEQADNARSIRKRGLREMATRIGPNLPDPSLAAFVKVAADVEVTVEEEQVDTHDALAQYRARVARAFELGRRWERRHRPQYVVVPPQA